jgi:hypothetical protein
VIGSENMRVSISRLRLPLELVSSEIAVYAW